VLGDKRIVTVVRSWLEGKPTLRAGLVIVCVGLAVLVVFAGITVILSASSKVEQEGLVSRYPDEETPTTSVSTRADSQGLVYEGSIARSTPVFEQPPIAAAVVVPSSTTIEANKRNVRAQDRLSPRGRGRGASGDHHFSRRDAVPQEPSSTPTLGVNERQATTAEPISSADELTSPMSEEDLGFSEELLEEEEQPEEVVEARVGEDAYARAW
jgi:hypothetical protein